MAEELNQIDEAAAIEAELRRLKEEQTTPPTPPEGTDTGIPPVTEEEPKVVVKPEGEDKPPEQESKPPEKTPQQEAVEREGRLRRLLKDQERRNKELEARLAEQQAPKTDEPPKDPTYEDDAAEYLRRRSEQLEQRNNQLEARINAKEQQDQLRRAEDDFSRQHPDYFKARDYLIKNEVEEWELSGLAEQHQATLANSIREGRRNPNFRAYTDHVNRVAQQDDVIEAAERNGRSVEDEAIYQTARDTYINQRGQGMVPAKVYALAQRRGYQVEQAAPQRDSSDVARQRVLQAKEISAATNSLSNASTASGSGSGPKVIRSRNDILALEDAELDSLITSGRYKEL